MIFSFLIIILLFTFQNCEDSDPKSYINNITDILIDLVSETLIISVDKALNKAILSGGSTMKDYVKADGTRGDYLDKFAQVFRREGQPCRTCGTKIIKIKVAGRGTHICPKCQKVTK